MTKINKNLLTSKIFLIGLDCQNCFEKNEDYRSSYIFTLSVIFLNSLTKLMLNFLKISENKVILN